MQATAASSVASDVARYPHVDALRGIAALLVVWLHVTQNFLRLSPHRPPAGQWLADVAQSLDVGRVGVVLFFLVSGYVIPSSIRFGAASPLRAFAIRRFFRIYPAYWLSVPFCAFATWWLWGMPFGATELLVNLTLLQDLFGVPSASGVYWTLLVELAFYVLCVALALTHSLFDTRRIAFLAVAFAVVHGLAAYALWWNVPLNRPLAFLPWHLSIMLCGTLFRHRRDDLPMTQATRWLFGLLVAYCAVIFPLAAIWALGPFNNYVVSSALGLLLFVLGTSVARVTSRVMVWLGTISYSIYLFHVPVSFPLLWWLLRQPEGSPWRTQHLGIYVLACAALTIVVAGFVHRFVEVPGIALGNRWVRRSPAPGLKGLPAAPRSGGRVAGGPIEPS